MPWEPGQERGTYTVRVGPLSGPQAQHEPWTQHTGLSTLLAKEPVFILGTTSVPHSVSLWGTRITEKISLKPNSRGCVVNFALPWFWDHKKMAPYCTTQPAFHCPTHICPPNPRTAFLMNLSILCPLFSPQPLFGCMVALIQLLRWLNPPPAGLAADLPASALCCWGMLHSHETRVVGAHQGTFCKMIWNCRRCGTVEVCIWNIHISVKAHSRKLGLSWNNEAKFNNFGLFRKVLKFSLHPISKAYSGGLIVEQSISLVGWAGDKLRDALISQFSYNI